MGSRYASGGGRAGSKEGKVSEGWGKSDSSRKWHYFDGSGMSLCRRIGLFWGDTSQSIPDCDKCTKCKAALETKKKAAGGQDEGG